MMRYHVNRLGRFSSPDLIAGAINNPQLLNRFAYVRNDPLNLIDPFGLQGCAADTCIDVSGAPDYFDTTNSAIGGWNYAAQFGGPGATPLEQILAGGRRGPGGDKERQVIKNALKQPKLAKCLNKFFGLGTILTNENLPHIDASKDLPGGEVGHTVVDQVPATGRGTVQIDRGIFASLRADDPFLVGTYLHEIANVLAIQRFTNVSKDQRALQGPRGGPPTESQRRSFDKDIGQQFEDCILGRE